MDSAMNCRTFHRSLEDYLQDGLDFSSRFGMERHAQQCLHCGKDLANAQSLRRMTADLTRVKAPSNFESLVSDKIAARKMRGPFSRIRSFGIYGFELPSWRKLALATSGLAILGFGIFYASHRQMLSPEPSLISEKPQSISPAPNPVPEKVEPVKVKTKESFQASLKAPVSKPKVAAESTDVADAKQYPPPIDFDALEKQGMAQAEAVNYLLVSPDNHAAPDRLPKKLYMPYGQTSEEYFIRNVSH
jgi:hypothetical protein